jgi:hypothetical protein
MTTMVGTDRFGVVTHKGFEGAQVLPSFCFTWIRLRHMRSTLAQQCLF